MTVSTSLACERKIPVPEYRARWKEIRRPKVTDGFRAICGKPGCPGSLGWLMELGASAGVNLPGSIDLMIESLVEQDRLYAEMQQRTILPPEITNPEGRAELLSNLRREVAELIDQATQARKAAADSTGKLNNAVTVLLRQGEVWALHPERPHREPDTPIERSPRPLYYGFSDSGYRISIKGNRARDGERIGRRPFHFKAPGPELERVHQDLTHPYTPTGQFVAPPCRIWCPVCASLNEVGLPPGFELEDAP